ncbi:U3 snoRNP-associated protein Lcp5 [Schizosaccharomyces pombe]|uniref:Uncharacterized protein C18B11.06 n=1 Tax=Schizosaccharomyces pombe (strain 972 / ATCC 24843) TaxID=284812 RepID=YA36_SCHPO|nr:putative U3 snoRNP-associated protein Lcp5 [Schizosaccharomyces pombe]Q09713.1 RecName: Full=Uncharacterized protein C18B11.06 [Schizosaccharomyces pombe 972h-]CAA90591.1 U3 snoRNP-associated protein Lcp5 (predicted) [Schizosaccharomyces pombe]|eukprot:NP_592877.1 putative U3 snoRNP-associated protein Lcp5 [Schizosaccharomyces pombe]
MDVLNKSIQTALEALPKTSSSSSDGVSLVSLKCQLLLSYVQKLAFLMLVKLDDESFLQHQDVVEKLVQLRIEIEKIRPLENRIQYSVDKLLRAAGRKEEIGSIKEPENNGNDKDSQDSLKLHYKPNLSEFADDSDGPASENNVVKEDDKSSISSEDEEEELRSAKDGIYRPPRIRAVTMDSEKRTRHRPNHLVDEFVSSDMSSVPQSMPSVGSNLEKRGRVIHADERELQKMRERIEYEESNYTRLPKLSKKDLKKSKRVKKHDYGGEDWSLLDRKFHDDDFSNRKLDLTSRAKRRANFEDVNDGSLASPVQIGQSYRKRKKNLKRR